MPRLKDDVTEIRRTVYGRDMRKPLADALVRLKEYYIDQRVDIDGLTSAETELLHDDYYKLKLTVSQI